MPSLSVPDAVPVRAAPGTGSWLAVLAEAQESILRIDGDLTQVARRLARAASGLVDARARVALPVDGRLTWLASCPADTAEGVDDARTASGDDPSSSPVPASRLDVPLVHGRVELGRVEVSADRPDWFDPIDRHALEALAAVASGWLAVGAASTRQQAAEQQAAEQPGAEQPGAQQPGAQQQAAQRQHAVIDLRAGPPGPDPRVEGQGGTAVAPVFGSARTVASGLGEAALRAAQELTGLGLWEWQPGPDRLDWSAEMYRLAGLDDARPLDLSGWLDLVHPQDRDRAAGLFQLPAAPGATRVETFRMAGEDGVLRHIQSWATVIEAPSPGQHSRGEADPGAGISFCGACLDVSGQVGDREMLQRLSATDPVTGLGNRLAFDHRMRELLAAPTAEVAVLLLDLDRFKQVNDTLGHQVGDRLLVEVANRLTSLLPAGCMTARMGGDEFVVLPPAGMAPAALRRLAQRVVDGLRAPYVLPDSEEMLVCPASMGVAASAGRRVNGDDLLREADLALYRAKDAGRDRFVVFDDVLRSRAQARHVAERSLRTALEQNRLALQYQPIVDFADGRVVGVEALVRMRDHTDRLLGPDAFIAVAEDTGLVVELDCWVIDAAVAQAGAWMSRHPVHAPWVAINVSARSMEHPKVARRLIEAVAPGGLPKGRIKVELTEHSFLDTLPGGDTALRQLLSSGIAVGIDDFGTGYSALAYLQRFDLDFMKIDRSFVAEVGREPRADAVVTAIVDLAHAHGMRVTAEGVENPRQARRLREIGCDFAQGYHFGRPGPAARIIRARPR